MDVDTAVDFARTHRRSVLVTQRRDGRPQLSNVLHQVSDDGLIRISVTADRAKYRNLVRDAWAALHVTQEDFWAYVVIEGDVQVSAPAARPGDAVVDELVDYYRAAAGEHDNWGEYRAAMVTDRRALVRIRPTRAYGMLRSA